MDEDVEIDCIVNPVVVTEISSNGHLDNVEEDATDCVAQEGPAATRRDSPGKEKLKLSLCLVCCGKVDLTLIQSHKSPLDQFNDLLQIFRISLSSFEQIRKTGEDILPLKLFCATCMEEILKAMNILAGIETLQNELKMVTTFLQRKLLRNQDLNTDSGDATKWIRKTRRTLTQCFSTCEVPIKSEKRMVRRRKRPSRRFPTRVFKTCFEKLEEPSFEETVKLDNDSNVDLDYVPSGSEEEMEISLKCNDWGIEETVGENLDGGDGLRQDSGLETKATKKKKKLNSPRETNDALGSASVPSYRTNRTYEDGKVISLDCPYCKRKLTREDFRTKSGEYIFKCFPECCERIMTNFIHVVRHHESLCPSMPHNLYSMKRKRKRLHIKKELDFETSASPTTLPWDKGFIYNEYRDVVAFECPLCDKKMSCSDFQTETGQFMFKCSWEACNKITRCFSNLCIHHRAHCVNKDCDGRIDLFRKKSRGSQQDFNDGSNEELGENHGREFNKAGRVVAYRCVHCQKKLTYGDFLDVTSSTYIYKCPPTCCDKVFSTFTNLINHHESQCKRRRVIIPDTNPNVLSVCISKEEKPLAKTETSDYNLPTSNSLNSFECKYCHKEYKREYFQQDCSETIAYKCDIPNCDKTFPLFSILQNHHESTCPKRSRDPFACTLCDKKFSCSKNVRTHMISFHTHNYKFYCEVCGAGIVSKPALFTHMKTHITVRKYKCSHCPASFKKNDHLRNHETRLHTTDLPFMCGTCGKRFKVRQGLKAHEQNVHNADGTANCPLCNKTFASAAYVHNHIRTTHNKMRDQSKRNKSVKPVVTDGDGESSKRKRSASKVKATPTKKKNRKKVKSEFPEENVVVVVDGIFTDNMG